MKIKTKYNIKKITANFFGALGYLSCCLQWVWVLVLYFDRYKDVLINLSKTDDYVGYDSVATFPIPEKIMAIAGIIIVILVVCMTVYVLFKMPSAIINTGKKFVRKSAEATSSAVIKAVNKKPTKKLRIKLTYEIAIAFKVVLVIIPLIFIYIYQFFDNQRIDYQIVEVLGYSLLWLSAVAFCLQYLMIKLLSVDKSDIW